MQEGGASTIQKAKPGGRKESPLNPMQMEMERKKHARALMQFEHMRRKQRRAAVRLQAAARRVIALHCYERFRASTIPLDPDEVLSRLRMRWQAELAASKQPGYVAKVLKELQSTPEPAEPRSSPFSSPPARIPPRRLLPNLEQSPPARLPHVRCSAEDVPFVLKVQLSRAERCKHGCHTPTGRRATRGAFFGTGHAFSGAGHAFSGAGHPNERGKGGGRSGGRGHLSSRGGGASATPATNATSSGSAPRTPRRTTPRRRRQQPPGQPLQQPPQQPPQRPPLGGGGTAAQSPPSTTLPCSPVLSRVAQRAWHCPLPRS